MATARRPRPGLVTFVLALAGTVVSLMQTMVIPLLPDMPALLGTSADSASWLVTATLLTGAAATPIVSRLADMFGKRRMLLLCLGVLLAGSVVGALTTSLPGAILARGLQGFAPAMIPVGISIMRDELPPDRVSSAVATMSATLGIGAAVGLPLSGIIYSTMDWQAVFWVSSAMAAGMILAVLSVVPESQVRSLGKFDYIGAVLLSIFLTALLLAISKGGYWGWRDDRTTGCLVAALLAGVVWLPWELRTGQPLVDVRTSVRRPVLLTNIASMLAGFAMFANMLVTTQQLQLPPCSGLGLSATQAGLGMLPGGIAMLLLAPVSAGITRRFGPKMTLSMGTGIMAGGYVGRVFAHDTVAQVVVGALVVSVGTAVCFAAMPIIIMRSVPITETAAANGLNTLMRSIGTATSSAAVAALMVAETVPVGGLLLPPPTAFERSFWLAAAAAMGATGLALLLPGRPRRVGVDEPRPHQLAQTMHEVIAHGQVSDAGGDSHAPSDGVGDATRW